MPTAVKLDYIAAILVGGHSRRFGSDKALADFGNGTSYLHLARRLAELQPTRVLLSGRSEQRELFPGLEFIADELATGGPFAGLLSVLRRYRSLPVLLVACDYRDVDTTLLRALTSSFDSDKFDAVAFRQQSNGNLFQPTLTLYAPSCLATMESMLGADEPCSLQRLLRRVRLCALESDALPEDIDYQVNTTQEPYLLPPMLRIGD